jgi:hypothetical protein
VSPARTSNTSITGRLVANGSDTLTRVNKEAQINKTRRAPSRPPRYTEKGPTNIVAALNAVLSHEASSTPRCREPLKSPNPTLSRRPVQVAIMAPSSTPPTPSKGCVVITRATVPAPGVAGWVGGVLKTVTHLSGYSCWTHESSPVPKSQDAVCLEEDALGQAES